MKLPAEGLLDYLHFSCCFAQRCAKTAQSKASKSCFWMRISLNGTLADVNKNLASSMPFNCVHHKTWQKLWKKEFKWMLGGKVHGHYIWPPVVHGRSVTVHRHRQNGNLKVLPTMLNGLTDGLTRVLLKVLEMLTHLKRDLLGQLHREGWSPPGLPESIYENWCAFFPLNMFIWYSKQIKLFAQLKTEK